MYEEWGGDVFVFLSTSPHKSYCLSKSRAVLRGGSVFLYLTHRIVCCIGNETANIQEGKAGMTDTLHIPEFAHGYLLCYSLYHASDVRESGEDDAWEQVIDVPLFAGKHCDYQTYDLNFWVDDEDDGRMYCTAYEVWHDEEGMAHTKTDEWRRLW